MPKFIATVLLLCVVLATPAGAQVQSLDALENGQVAFVMPSGNIGCLYTPEGGTDVYMPADGGPELICERIEPSYVTVILSDVDEAVVIEDPGEQGCCGTENVLAYGNEVELDGFVCLSAETGLTCENDEGYGFTMARAGVEVFEADDETADDDTEIDDAEATDD